MEQETLCDCWQYVDIRVQLRNSILEKKTLNSDENFVKYNKLIPAILIGIFEIRNYYFLKIWTSLFMLDVGFHVSTITTGILHLFVNVLGNLCIFKLTHYWIYGSKFSYSPFRCLRDIWYHLILTSFIRLISGYLADVSSSLGQGVLKVTFIDSFEDADKRRIDDSCLLVHRNSLEAWNKGDLSFTRS